MAEDPGESDPALERWGESVVHLRERHSDFAESAQGVATDGEQWYVVSNRSVAGLMRKITNPTSVLNRYRNTRRVGVYDLRGAKVSEVAPAQEIWAELVARNRASGRKQEIHLGAPCWTDGVLLVPTQRPSGVWLLSDHLRVQDWWPDPAPVRPERFSWVDLRPSNGLLYTTLHWHPGVVEALEWRTLNRVPEADIRLGTAALRLDRVQGGAFTPNERILLSTSQSGGQVFCYSARTGASQGVLHIGTHHELEGIAVRSVEVQGRAAQVHLLSAETDYLPFVRWGDSFAIHSYSVPHPAEL